MGPKNTRNKNQKNTRSQNQKNTRSQNKKSQKKINEEEAGDSPKENETPARGRGRPAKQTKRTNSNPPVTEVLNDGDDEDEQETPTKITKTTTITTTKQKEPVEDLEDDDDDEDEVQQTVTPTPKNNNNKQKKQTGPVTEVLNYGDDEDEIEEVVAAASVKRKQDVPEVEVLNEEQSISPTPEISAKRAKTTSTQKPATTTISKLLELSDDDDNLSGNFLTLK